MEEIKQASFNILMVSKHFIAKSLNREVAVAFSRADGSFVPTRGSCLLCCVLGVGGLFFLCAFVAVVQIASGAG